VAWTDVLLELNEKAIIANERVERVIGLHRVELILGEKALAQGSHSKVNEGMEMAATAKPAGSYVVV
jgi:hypothetical protein